MLNEKKHVRVYACLPLRSILYRGHYSNIFLLVPKTLPIGDTRPYTLIRGTILNRTKYCYQVVKIAEYIYFCVYRRSYLIWFPVKRWYRLRIILGRVTQSEICLLFRQRRWTQESYYSGGTIVNRTTYCYK